jgi:hypothetical protein
VHDPFGGGQNLAFEQTLTSLLRLPDNFNEPLLKQRTDLLKLGESLAMADFDTRGFINFIKIVLSEQLYIHNSSTPSENSVVIAERMQAAIEEFAQKSLLMSSEKLSDFQSAKMLLYCQGQLV